MERGKLSTTKILAFLLLDFITERYITIKAWRLQVFFVIVRAFFIFYIILVALESNGVYNFKELKSLVPNP
jgi:hypothetical protein